MKPLLGALAGVLIGSCCLAIPIDPGLAIPIDPGPRLKHLVTVPLQTLLPLLGAGGSGVPPCTPVAALVQQNDALGGSCTTCTATLSSAPSSGNMVELVTTGLHLSALISVSSVSSTNTTWTRDGSSAYTQSTTNGSLELWHGLVSGGSGGTSITVTWSVATLASGFTWTVQEWSGLSTSSPADGAAALSIGTVSPVTTAAYSTSASCDLVIVAMGQGTNGGITAFPGAPYTNLTNATGASFAAYNVSAPIGAQTTASWSLSGARNWRAFVQGYLHM